MAIYTSINDKLNLKNNKTIKNMIRKYGKNQNEEILYSDYTLKINRREKSQTRVILITNKAIYNLKPKKISKCLRRISMDKIGSLSVSKTSNEFVIHVFDEYDYRYINPLKEKIVHILSEAYKKECKKPLKAAFIEQSSLKERTLTKVKAKDVQNREERIKRRAILLDISDDDSDNKEMMIESKPLLETKEKVGMEDFDLLKVIGRGSFGKVMQVRKKDTHKIYAMKIIKKESVYDRNQVEHTKSERRILQALQHPFLVKLRYAFQTSTKLYFILDYYKGGELFYHLKKNGRFNEKTARFFISEVTLALGHLHELDVIYRDLKPENVLLDDKGHIVLTDFGLSKDLCYDDMKSHTFCGTPEYLAPEIISGMGHDKAVDWWSLGILLYELTVGIPPFYSQNVNEMYRRIQNSILRFPPFLSYECKNLIELLLNRNSEDRLGSSSEDVEEIKNHVFFKDIDWKLLSMKKIQPPYNPSIHGKYDTSNFESQFTNEPVIDSYVKDSGINQNADDFTGFTYVSKKM